jgi:hypothetical protein
MEKSSNSNNLECEFCNKSFIVKHNLKYDRNNRCNKNHNIYISNMRDNYVMIYNGDKWGLVGHNEAI